MALAHMYDGQSGAWSHDGTVHYTYSCSVDYDDVARVLTVNAQGAEDGFTPAERPAPTPAVWELNTLLGNNQTRTDSLLPIYNLGPQTFTNVNIKLGTGKGGKGIQSIQETFKPPAG